MKHYLAMKQLSEEYSDVQETIKVIEQSAASHIHILKKKVGSFVAYKEEIERVLARLTGLYQEKEHPLLARRYDGDRVLIMITGDKGIVGGLYHNLLTEWSSHADSYDRIMIIGSKGSGYAREEGIMAETLPLEISDTPSLEMLRTIGKDIIDMFLSQNISRIDVLYSRFLSINNQQAAIVPFLPFQFFADYVPSGTGTQLGGFPIFEPSKKILFNELLEKYIDIFLVEILLESKLSEFSARTTTSEAALSQTAHLITQTRLSALKIRRTVITQHEIEQFSAHTLSRRAHSHSI